jgi:nucleotide-binding universal stress UspA family protein
MYGCDQWIVRCQKKKRIPMTKVRILVPIDFKEQSDLALEYAGPMARKLNAMISCMHVIEEQGLLADKLTSEKLRHKHRREAEHKLSERVNSLLRKEEKTPFEIIVTSGKVHQKVLEKSIDLKAQIIVMGRSNACSDKAAGLGSNAKKILSSSIIPVFTVSRRSKEKPKDLILPLDLSRPYSDQLNWAIESAVLFDAAVTVVSVIDKKKSGLKPVYVKKLQELESVFTERNIGCATHLLENHSTVSREIVSFSNRTEAGILLLMPYQDEESSGSQMGPITSEVLSGTKVPVLYIAPRNRFGLSLDRSSQYFQPIYPSRIPIQDPLI